MKERISEEFCELIEDQLDKMIKKGDISPSEMDNAYKAVKTVYYLTVMDEMKEAKEEGYGAYSRDGYSRGYSNEYSNNSYRPYSMDGWSNDQSYRGGNGSSYDGHSMDGRRGRDGDSDGRYSEARGRDARGRYMSRDDEKEHMKRTIEEMKQKLDHMN